MKLPFRRTRGFLALATLLQLLPPTVRADSPVAPPALQFASGLPGKQVSLSWVSEAGVRYRIERSSSLSSDWKQIALVEATGADSTWLDPEATKQKAFYRVVQPQAEVFSIFMPVLTTVGGELRIQGQCIPAGSVLVLTVDGVAQSPVALDPLGNGEWLAILGGALPGGAVISARVEDGNGVTLVTIDQTITVTATGRALDSPPSLPPAAPMGASKPVPRIGIVVKSNSPHKRSAPGPEGDCDDADPFSPLGMAINEKGLPAEKKIKKTNTPKRPGSGGVDDDCDGFNSPVALGMAIKTKGTGAAHNFADDQSSPLLIFWLSKKGYDYYQAQSAMGSASSKKGYDYYQARSDMAAAGAQTNPVFTENSNQGEMPTEPGGGFFSSAPPIGVSAAPSGLPGEVSFRSCDLSLPCPAGPPLAWVCTYRSMVPTSSGHGPGWDFAYNIRIEAASSTAPQVTVHDGGGRSDVFLRQADGSYRCDGMFREGRFDGETFTLTFADKGTWTFTPLGTSSDAGKIATITDRNGVGLACAYDLDGQLETVTDAFGRHLTVEWGNSPPRILSVVAADSVSLNFSKIEFRYDTGGKRESVSAPFVPGQAPVAGLTTYAYSSSTTDPRLDDNLLSITDGAGRLMEAFTYSSSAPSEIDFDTCASHDRHKTYTGHVTLNRREIRPPGSSPSSAYTDFEVDEIGRLTETDFDSLHRVVACREFTGFCTPNVPVTSSSNRPTGKLRDSDPAYFETTCAYNADSLCTRITRPDGSQELVTYDRDFRQDCPVRERGNPRVISLRASGPAGELRTVTCDYQPDFGNPESARPGNPIKGITVKGGRNPGGDIVNAVVGGAGHTVEGVTANHRLANYQMKEEGGRHTPFHNKYRPQSTVVAGGITGGVVAGIVVAACTAGEDQDCDGTADDADQVARAKPKQKAWLCSNFRIRMVNAHGQVSTFGYDTNGNCTSYISALPARGNLYQYDSSGRCTQSTMLNGPASSFIDDFAYGTDGFLSSATSDSAGLHLTTSFGRDAQGRVTSVTDPRGSEWLYAYNPLHQCIQIQSPPMPSGAGGTPPYRITTDFTIDNGGRIVRCDMTHLGPDGSPDPVNPAYSTFFVRDERARLVRVAGEERPVDGSSTLDPSSLGIENFVVCDFTHDDAGQLVRLSTPAACREQSSDLACAFTYDERGLLHRCIEGDTGDPAVTGTVTTEYDYDSLGSLVRCAMIDSGGTSPETFFEYDGFHRLFSTTNPMGNVASFEYGNDGSVTTSIYGEVNDVPGSAGNVLLSRSVLKEHFQNGDIPTQDRLGRPAINTAFFRVESEDDTITEERFSPGDAGPHATEVTVVDRSPAGLVQSVTRNGDLLLSCDYDSAGRRVRCADGSCSAQATLDECGNVTALTRTDISGVNGVPSKTFTTSNFRDPFGRVTQFTDGGGNVATIAYDSLSRPVSITAPGRPQLLCAYDGGAVDPTGDTRYSVQVSCDITGTGTPEVLSSCLVRSGEYLSETDANGYSTVCTHDTLGRTTHCDYPDGTSKETTFDSLGRPVSHGYQDGAVAVCEFDLNGRPTRISRSVSASDPPSEITVCGHDALGAVSNITRTSVSGEPSLLTFTHDSLGNTVGEIQDGHTITRTFNHRGRTGITYPDGKHFNESRDALGRLLAITNSIGGNVVTMAYAGHRVVRSVQGNGVVTTWSYRADGEAGPTGDFSFDTCVRSTITSPLSEVLSDEITVRDRSQQVTRCGILFASGAGAPYRSKTFTRDGLGRIIACVTERRETSNGPVLPESGVSYVLGTEGRRISEVRNNVAGDYTQSSSLPPGDFQMGQYTTWPGGTDPIEWDANGNLGAIATPTTKIAFAHNVAGQVTSVSDVSDPATPVTLVSYDYDAVGRRASRSLWAGTTSVRTSFVYDGDECIQELGADGLADMTFVSSGGIKHSISTRNGTYYYPINGSSSEATSYIGTCDASSDSYVGPCDASVRGITSSTGIVVERFDCDDACKPVFLNAAGLPTLDTNSSIGLRWLASECAWEPEIGMFACSGGIYSPDLGTVVSSSRLVPKAQTNGSLPPGK